MFISGSVGTALDVLSLGRRRGNIKTQRSFQFAVRKMVDLNRKATQIHSEEAKQKSHHNETMETLPILNYEGQNHDQNWLKSSEPATKMSRTTTQKQPQSNRKDSRTKKSRVVHWTPWSDEIVETSANFKEARPRDFQKRPFGDHGRLDSLPFDDTGTQRDLVGPRHTDKGMHRRTQKFSPVLFASTKKFSKDRLARTLLPRGKALQNNSLPFKEPAKVPLETDKSLLKKFVEMSAPLMENGLVSKEQEETICQTAEQLGIVLDHQNVPPLDSMGGRRINRALSIQVEKLDSGQRRSLCKISPSSISLPEETNLDTVSDLNSQSHSSYDTHLTNIENISSSSGLFATLNHPQRAQKDTKPLGSTVEETKLLSNFFSLAGKLPSCTIESTDTKSTADSESSYSTDYTQDSESVTDYNCVSMTRQSPKTEVVSYGCVGHFSGYTGQCSSSCQP